MKKSLLFNLFLGVITATTVCNEPKNSIEKPKQVLDNEIKRLLQERKCRSCKLSLALLKEAIKQAHAEGTLPQELELQEVDLKNSSLQKVDLSELNCSHASLEETDLSEVNLSQANLSGAKLTGANLTNAIAKGTDFRNSNITEEQLQQCKLCQAKVLWLWGLWWRYRNDNCNELEEE
jgi:uncharacterized protein YjbI with pentapeptide repeats